VPATAQSGNMTSRHAEKRAGFMVAFNTAIS
jgi:hypothetical protein